MYFEFYFMGIILVPAIILALFAQVKVKSNYAKYSEVYSKKGMKAFEVARLILDTAGLSNVKVVKINGELTDNFDPRTNTVSLSSSVYDSSSVAAIGIASHEVGHALQYAKHYAPIKIRSILVGACNISSTILWPIVLIGLLLDFGASSPLGNIFIISGVAFFGLTLLFNLITLPVEYNASNRAKSILVNSEILGKDEMVGVNKVLNAAALTYVAALLISLLNLIRFILIVRRRD